MLYTYKCQKCGKPQERIRKIAEADEPIKCSEKKCDGMAIRVDVEESCNFQLKGRGFYTTDNNPR